MASYAPILFALLALLAHANATLPTSASVQFNPKGEVTAELCGKTLFKDLCVSAFASLPEAQTGDVFGLASIALTTVTRQAIATHAYIQLLNKRSADTSIKARLSDCATNYQSAIDNLKQSAKSLESKNFSDVNTFVTAAMTEGTSCADGIKEVRKSLPRLSPFNRKFNGLCSIVLTFTNQCGAPKLDVQLH